MNLGGWGKDVVINKLNFTCERRQLCISKCCTPAEGCTRMWHNLHILVESSFGFLIVTVCGDCRHHSVPDG